MCQANEAKRVPTKEDVRHSLVGECLQTHRALQEVIGRRGCH